MSASPNSNCLHGFRCPVCGQHDEFRIAISAVAKVTDDGAEIVSDIEWNDDSSCLCPRCEYQGPAAAFMESAA